MRLELPLWVSILPGGFARAFRTSHNGPPDASAGLLTGLPPTSPDRVITGRTWRGVRGSLGAGFNSRRTVQTESSRAEHDPSGGSLSLGRLAHERRPSMIEPFLSCSSVLPALSCVQWPFVGVGSSAGGGPLRDPLRSSPLAVLSGRQSWVSRGMKEAPWDFTLPRASRESVDGWPMATVRHQTFGGQPMPVPAHTGVTGGWYPPSGEPMSRCTGVALTGPKCLRGGPFSEGFSGGNRMARGFHRRREPRRCPGPEADAFAPLPAV